MGVAMSLTCPGTGGAGHQHCSPHPSLDFSYQDQPESSGSELEEVMALRPPSSQGRAR